MQVDILGTGTMGRDIAVVSAKYGNTVNLWTRKEDIIQCSDNLTQYFLKVIAKAGFSDLENINILENISVKKIPEDFILLNSSDIVIESISENEHDKIILLNKVSQYCSHHTVLGTNTSSLDINKIARKLNCKANFMGIHFFSPVYKNKLVELSLTEFTEDDTYKRAESFVSSIKMNMFNVPPVAGYVYNRLLFAQIREALNLVDRYNVKPQLVDDILTSQSGVKYGIFRIMDLVGLDVISESLDNMYENDITYKRSELLDNLIDNGYYGKKSGKGIYEYNNLIEVTK